MTKLVAPDRTVFIGRLDGVAGEGEPESTPPVSSESAPFEADSFRDLVKHFNPKIRSKLNLVHLSENGLTEPENTAVATYYNGSEPYHMVRSFDPPAVLANTISESADGDPSVVDHHPLLRQSVEMDALDELLAHPKWRRILEAGEADIRAQMDLIDGIIARYENAL